MSVPQDSRLEAFCSPQLPEVFHSVCHRHEIFQEDPLDAPAIHRHARDAFERLLQLAITPPGLSSGRILLLKGESGAGKTHLMRAFRSATQNNSHGYFCYMQMTTATDDYSHYILSNVIDSLDHAYQPGSESGMLRLSNALLDGEGLIKEEMRKILRERETSVTGIDKLVNSLADQLVQDDPRLHKIDVEVLRALLFLQTGEPKLKGRVLNWLRCENLSPHDQALLGGIVPKQRQDAQRMIEQLAKLMWELQGAALVICADQLEDMVNFESAGERFRRAMSALTAIADRTPSAVIVISCLEDYYSELSKLLTRSVRDRIELDPPPISLVGNRSAEEIEALVRIRLEHLYDRLDTPFYAKDPLYPFTTAHVERWSNMRARDVLDACRGLREQAIALKRLPNPNAVPDDKSGPSAPPPAPLATSDIEQAWNDLVAGWTGPLDDDDDRLAELLAVSIERSAAELETGHTFKTRPFESYVEVDIFAQGQKRPVEQLLLGVCNGRAQAGKLAAQLDELVAKAKGRTPVALRTSDFPDNPKTQIAQKLGKFITKGGRRVVVKESDWRAMRVMTDFIARTGTDAAFAQWQSDENPLSRLVGLKDAIRYEALPGATAKAAVSPAPAESLKAASAAAVLGVSEASAARPAVSASPQAPLVVGYGRDVSNEPIALDPGELLRHAAFLGGTGSGKTTLAMYIVEAMLQRGIPAILLDRKGDLSSYGSTMAWRSPARDTAHETARAALMAKVETRVYTPGNPTGRPLAIPLAPKDLKLMTAHDRDQAVTYSAASLASMLGFTNDRRAQTSIAVLRQTLSFLVKMEQEVNLESLLKTVGDPPMALVNALGLIDTKMIGRLGEQLQALQLNGGPLVNGAGEQLEVDALLGRGTHATPGKTRLSIVSTKFLGDTRNVLFFVAQLFVALGRWTSRNPSKQLQAILLTDEADLYLPATSKPCTKEPLEHLLRRARSAGLSMLLATQSPGDLDYRCRDNIRSWFVGQVREPTAINKMKPMLSEIKVDVASKLPKQATGEFHLLRDGGAQSFKALRSAVNLEQLSEDDIVSASMS